MQNSLVKTFTQNYRPAPKSKVLRKVGIELELPIVQDDGTAVSYKTIRKMFSWLEEKNWKLIKDEGTGESVAAEKSITTSKGRFGYSTDVIGTDVGYCTVETSLTPGDSLFELEKHWKKIKTTLLEFFTQEKCHILGYGVQPITPPSRKLVANKGRYRFFEQDSLNRFIDQKYGVDLHVFTTSAANQCHIDIYREEAITAVNVLNGLAPLLSAVTANASVWKGDIDPDWIDIREIFWDKSWSNRIEQTGIPDVFKNFSDYVDRLCQFRPLMVKRNGEYIKILNCKTFGEFLQKGSRNSGETVLGKKVKLTSHDSDIQFHNGFAWWDARLASSYGTLEVRPCGQQPERSIISVSAFALGLIENLSGSKKLYEEYTIEDWRRLRFDVLRHGLKATISGKPVVSLVSKALSLAREGLMKRKLGEEIFLDVFDERVRKKETLADEVKKVFKKNDLRKFFQLVEIH